MKPVFLLVLFLSIFNCKENSVGKQKDMEVSFPKDESMAIDSVMVSKNQLVLNQNQGIWYYHKKPFNGYSVKFYPNGIMQEKLGFFKGKRQGIAKRWSENGVLRTECFYNQNKLMGVYKSFWENGALSQEAYYENGVQQGIEKQWYPDGQLAKLRHIVDGNEQGMQQAWLKNGTLYVNYEAKNGRVFGLLRSNLCYQLKNEIVIKDKDI